MSDRDFWVRAAQRLAMRRNIASWSDAFLPAFLGLTVIAALVLLALRLMGLAAELHILWITWAGMLVAAALACAVIAGRRPFSLPDSLSRLDEVGHLHNRLISAHAGIGDWPPLNPRIRDTVRWNWPRLTVPMLTSALLLAAAALLDLPKLAVNSHPNEEPIAWTQTESWLQTLGQAKILDQPALDKLKEDLGDLHNQPEKDWYSQSSLEAGDALRQQTGQSLRELQQDLEKSSDLLTQAQQASQMSASDLHALSASLQEAAKALQSGNLPANKELTGKLRTFDPSTLKTMSPDQMRALQQRLAAGAKVCGQCVGPNLGDGCVAGGDGHRSGKTGADDKFGKGASGIPGGGGPADLGLDDTSENLHTKRMEGASNDDPTRALPGQVIAIAKGKHNVDKTTPSGPVTAGAISSAGQGGDAVWRDSLTPDERQVLQRYFK